MRLPYILPLLTAENPAWCIANFCISHSSMAFLNPKLYNIWHVWVLSADAKSETAYSETEGSQDAAEEVVPASVSNTEDPEANQESVHDGNGSESSQSTFSYDQLKVKSDNPVTGIDFKRREVCPVMNFSTFLKIIIGLVIMVFICLFIQAYLSEEEFQTVFGTTKEAFYKLPKWKQELQKKKFDLF